MDDPSTHESHTTDAVQHFVHEHTRTMTQQLSELPIRAANERDAFPPRMALVPAPDAPQLT